MGKKIAFLVTAFAILVFTNLVEAQQAGKVYRIGYLAPNRINPAFPQRLEHAVLTDHGGRGGRGGRGELKEIRAIGGEHLLDVAP